MVVRVELSALWIRSSGASLPSQCQSPNGPKLSPPARQRSANARPLDCHCAFCSQCPLSGWRAQTPISACPCQRHVTCSIKSIRRKGTRKTSLTDSLIHSHCGSARHQPLVHTQHIRHVCRGFFIAAGQGQPARHSPCTLHCEFPASSRPGPSTNKH